MSKQYWLKKKSILSWKFTFGHSSKYRIIQPLLLYLLRAPIRFLIILLTIENSHRTCKWWLKLKWKSLKYFHPFLWVKRIYMVNEQMLLILWFWWLLFKIKMNELELLHIHNIKIWVCFTVYLSTITSLWTSSFNRFQNIINKAILVLISCNFLFCSLWFVSGLHSRS